MRNLPLMFRMALFAIVLFLPTVSWGVPLSLDSFRSTPLKGTSLAQRPELAGTVIADTTRALDLRFSFTPTDTTPFIVRDFVVRTGGGTLDFYRQVLTCCPTPTNAPVAFRGLSFSSFAGVTTDVDFRTDLGGKPSPVGLEASRTADTVRFSYSTGGGLGSGVRLPEDLSLQPIFVKTDATAFNEGGVLDVPAFNPDGSGASTNLFPGFYQPAIIPEPSTWFLLSSGLAGIALARVWKRVAPSHSQ